MSPREQPPVNSVAISVEGTGGPADSSGHRRLDEYGIRCKGRPDRQLSRADYDSFDLLIGMDWANLRNMNRICGDDPDDKIRRLLDFTDHPGDVADPWYTGDFEATWRDVLAGCRGILREVMA